MSGGEVVITRTQRSGHLALAVIIASTLLLLVTLWTGLRDETLTERETLQTVAVSLGLFLFGVPALRAARRTRVSVKSHDVLVTNGYYVHEFPVSSAEVVITEEPADHDQVVPTGVANGVATTRRMYLSDGERRVPVDAALGLVPRDFDKLAEDITKAIDDARGRLRSPS